jgi:hypothetical protein
MPPLVVEGYGRAMSSFPEMPFVSTIPATLGRVNGAVFAAAFLAGLIGLFQVVAARRADDRLAICGFDRATLLASRLGAVLAAALAGAVVTFAALRWQVTPEAPLVALGALVLAGATYGLLGILLGAVLPRELEGSLALVFVADLDTFLASGLVDVDTALVRALPLHYPHELFRAAVLEGSVATADLRGAVASLAVLLVAVLLVYTRVAGGDHA